MPDANLVDERYSFGTGPPMNSVLDVADAGEFDRDIILINVSTLLRNRDDKSKSTQQLIAGVKDEMENIVLDFVGVASLRFIENMFVVFYVSNYTNVVPKEYRRPINANDARVLEGTQYFVKKYINPSRKVYENINIVKLALQGPIQPQTKLVNLISAISNKRKILMLTHCPIDYHVKHRLPNLHLLESFTGKIELNKDTRLSKYEPDLNTKVFGQWGEFIPFNKSTHAILGDKKYIKPSIGVKEKRRMQDLAKREAWKLAPYESVRIKLQIHGFDVPFTIR